MKRNPILPPNFMLGYVIAAPNLQNYVSQGRRGLLTSKFIPRLNVSEAKDLKNVGK
ncbi:hypothetical protein [Nostoc sp.]|uniref:hypothetical protein n=1 Tax=Nostoc sp. TaxID=1180 RepID=UPI002FFA606E